MVLSAITYCSLPFLGITFHEVCELMWSYYDGLCARVCTDAWETELIHIGISLPQGCTASTVNFNVIFQVLLDYHSGQLVGERGYHIAKVPSIRVEKPTFADDVALVESSAG